MLSYLSGTVNNFSKMLYELLRLYINCYNEYTKSQKLNQFQLIKKMIFIYPDSNYRLITLDDKILKNLIMITKIHF